MNICYLNFASAPFYRNQLLACDRARQIGIHNIVAWTDERFREERSEFFEKHKEILGLSRGAGYWLWKPFLIHEMLTTLSADDILVYADTGVFFKKPLTPLIELAGLHEQVFFNMPTHSNAAWTKRDVFQALNADMQECWHTPQVKAQMHLWKVCESSVTKSREWLELCCDQHLITDAPSVSPNMPEYVEHRHDQSILSVLVWKWGNRIFRDPTQEGNGYVDLFPDSHYEMLAFAQGLIQE